MEEYEATWESLDRHETPDWYHDAKLGIFVHWGIYSVPAWAPTEAEIGGERDSPYAEWYPYYMYRDGSQTKEYHRERYGEAFEYIDFLEEWSASEWKPDEWATLFADVGARYVVLTGEHHDGFPLWGTQYAKYNAVEQGPKRDIVGELGTAVRNAGLRFAASYHANYNYYQPGYDGLFGHPDYEPGGPGESEGGPGPEYVDFMNAKHRELIRKYEPDLLWFDVPKASSDHVHATELIADYYNTAAEQGREVVVNDRAATDTIGPTIDFDGADRERETHGDFVTPEYVSFDEIRDEKWESCRGIGHSFGYNRAEDEEDYLAPEALVRSFVDIVSKNGNLLLNVGPRADGTIPETQVERLVALGEWLSINDEAIFATRPWIVAEDDASDVDVRYTWRDNTLYAIALDWPGSELELSVPQYVDLASVSESVLLTSEGRLGCRTSIVDDTLTVSLPEEPNHDYAYVVALSEVENPRYSKN